jgi:uncharacterized protein
LGKVKTRLVQDVGDETALVVYYRLLEHTRSITQNLPVQKFLYYSEFVDTEDNWPNSLYQKRVQSAGQLGDKMEHAFVSAFAQACGAVVIIGTDCMELSSEIIMDAFDHLDRHDAVIGPAVDGGYYLLGLKSHHSEIFRNKAWSTHTVLHDTETDFEKLGLRWHKLPLLRDVDTFDDLDDKMKAILRGNRKSPKPS